MKISRLIVSNYRTLEDFSINFPTYYSAICGKNDSGKTNILRIIRSVMKEETPYPFFDDEDLSLKDDYTKWLSTSKSDRFIKITFDILIESTSDEGLHEFVTTYLALKSPPEDLMLKLTLTYSLDDPVKSVLVEVNNKKFIDLKAQEILKKLQSSRTVLFHNSTEPELRYIGRESSGVFKDISDQHSDEILNLKRNVSKSLNKIAKSQQKEFEELLGRLERKYKVGLSLPTFDFTYIPFDLTLGDKQINVPLTDWGSGTRNRTLILLTLFRTKKISESTKSASKITPIIVIEEPESFLHPSAQSEFGRILQDLAEEFKIQVISTTHSPYMLNQNSPQSNILVERKVIRNKLRQTLHVDTSGDNWMEPFGLALGLDNKDFIPWKDLFFKDSESIILVEGDTDKEYFELLRDPVHGENRLYFDGDIFPYNGKDNLKNGVLLKFIKNKYNKIFVTFDLDALESLTNCLSSLGLLKNRHYLPIGINKQGKDNIEGIIPESITSIVYGNNSTLVQQAMSGNSSDRKSARQQLKKLILSEFKSTAKPGPEYYEHFYSIAKIINAALK